MIHDDTVAIYVLFDDLLKAMHHREHPLRRVNDALVLTTVSISMRYFGGNITKGIGYMKGHHCRYMLGKSRFNRRWHALDRVAQECFQIISGLVKSHCHRQRYSMDTFPVGVCHNIRIGRCKLLQGEDYRGWNASKREYFYGFKAAVLSTEDGIPVEIGFVPGAFAEQSVLKRLDFDLPWGSTVYGDSGFTDYEWEDTMKELEGIDFLVARKKGSLRGDTFIDETAKKQNRKRIETSFSTITNDFPKRIRAVTLNGFIFKLWMFIVSHAITMFFGN
jgi:hypothetical protein